MEKKLVQGSSNKWAWIWIDTHANQCRTHRSTPCEYVNTTGETAQRLCADYVIAQRGGYLTRETAEEAERKRAEKAERVARAEAALDREDPLYDDED